MYVRERFKYAMYERERERSECGGVGERAKARESIDLSARESRD